MTNKKEISKEMYKFSRPDHFFKLQKFAVKMVAFWPNDQDVSYGRYALTLINAFYLTFLICGVEFNYAYINRANLGLVLDCLTPTITKAVTGIKLFVLYYHRDTLKFLIRAVYDLFVNGEFVDFIKRSYLTEFSYIF